MEEEKIAWYHEDASIVEVVRELLRVKCGGRDDQTEVIAPKAWDVLHQAEQHVCVQRALVRLVYHHHAVALSQKQICKV